MVISLKQKATTNELILNGVTLKRLPPGSMQMIKVESKNQT